MVSSISNISKWSLACCVSLLGVFVTGCSATNTFHSYVQIGSGAIHSDMSTSSASTGTLSLSGIATLLEERNKDQLISWKASFVSDPDLSEAIDTSKRPDYAIDFIQSLTSQERQAVNNYLTDNRDFIQEILQAYLDENKHLSPFELKVDDQEKYYWVQDDGIKR